jgi:hypothetical protein
MGFYVLDVSAMVSLRSPTLGVHIQGSTTRLRHVSGNDCQCSGKVSSTGWLDVFAVALQRCVVERPYGV